MFGQLFGPALKGMSKFFSTERVLMVILLLALIWALSGYSNNKTAVVDEMQDATDGAEKDAGSEKPEGAEPKEYTTNGVETPAALLPKDENNEWSKLNPVGTQGGEQCLPDLLTAGYHIGLDTIGQTLRNANLQLRSDPTITKSDVGPWNQSTIETTYAQTPFEIGECKK